MVKEICDSTRRKISRLALWQFVINILDLRLHCLICKKQLENIFYETSGFHIWFLQFT